MHLYLAVGRCLTPFQHTLWPLSWLRTKTERAYATTPLPTCTHVVYKGGRHGGDGRGWRPTIASSKANFCSRILSSSRPAVLFPLLHTSPSPRNPSPSPSKNVQTASIIFMQFRARNALPRRQIPVQAKLWFMHCLNIKFQLETCSLRLDIRPQNGRSLHRKLTLELREKSALIALFDSKLGLNGT